MMVWGRMRLEGMVWKVSGLNHIVYQWFKRDEDSFWDTQCGIETLRVSRGGKEPAVFKGLVTCLQCLAYESKHGGP